MSTCNFAFDNVLVAIDSDGWEDYEVDDLIDNVGAELESKIGRGCATRQAEDGLRSYPGTIIYTVDVDGAYGTYRTIEVILRSGYYSGLNLDYKISDLVYYDNERKTLERKVEALSRKITKIISRYGTELRVVARFSNGEALYEKK